MAKAIIWDNGQGGVAITAEQPHWNGNVQARLDKFKAAHPDAEIVELDNAEIPIQAGSFNEHGYPNIDKTFRMAMKRGEQGKKVGIDMTKAKEHTHQLRRLRREKQLTPLDEQINFNIGDSTKVNQIESQRQNIRDSNATLQNEIDAVDNAAVDGPEQLKAIIDREGL